MLTLYQFPISHYCEKIRWALEYKKLDYQVNNFLPGLHGTQAKKIAGSTSLPILLHDGYAVQNSRDIIDYLDHQFPEFPLTPAEPHLREEALAWEKFADEEIGIPVRMVCYHILLDHPDVLIPLFTANGPWYGPMLMKIIFSKLSRRMRALMKLDEKTAQLANKRLERAIDKVYSHLKNRAFLTGDRFTRADLTTAALLAPLCKAEKYGLNWPKTYPEPLEAVIAAYTDKIAWVNSIYKHYR